MFSYSTSHHPDLPSFPTRRSSDLCSCPFASPTSIWRSTTRWRCPPGHVTLSVWMMSETWMPRWRLPMRGLCPCRSEEHTSELQSRGHLVCRLLLEKKKIYLLHYCN